MFIKLKEFKCRKTKSGKYIVSELSKTAQILIKATNLSIFLGGLNIVTIFIPFTDIILAFSLAYWIILICIWWVVVMDCYLIAETPTLFLRKYVKSFDSLEEAVEFIELRKILKEEDKEVYYLN